MSFPTPCNTNYAVRMSSCCIRLGKLLMAVIISISTYTACLIISISTYTACLLSHQIGQAPYSWYHQQFTPDGIHLVASSWVSSLRLLSLEFQYVQHISCCTELGELLMAVVSISVHTAYLLLHQIGQAPYGCYHQQFRPDSMSLVASSWVSSLWLLSLTFQHIQHISCCTKLGELLMDVIISISAHTAYFLLHQVGQAPYGYYHQHLSHKANLLSHHIGQALYGCYHQQFRRDSIPPVAST